jgi:hypothetical protein
MASRVRVLALVLVTLVTAIAAARAAAGERGGKLITVFSPGGFDRYLEKLSSLSDARSENAALMQSLAEEHDIWPA